MSASLAAVAALRDAGRHADAETALRGDAAAKTPEGLALLVHLHLLQGQLPAAKAVLEDLDMRAPGSPALDRARARVLQREGRVAEAVVAARRAHEADRDDEDGALVLANALLATGDSEAARTLAAAVVARRPASAPGQFVLAQAAGRLGDRPQAIAACEAALRLRPDYPLWSLQGALLLGSERPEAAAQSFRQALARNPAESTAAIGLGDALAQLGEVEEALRAFEAALAREPSLRNLLKARLTLPPLPASREEIRAARTRFLDGVAEARGWPGDLDGSDLSLPTSWFYLAYHGADDRPIMEALDGLFAAKAPSATFAAPALADWRAPIDGRPIRVGFVSQYLGDHTVGRLYQGLITGLDRGRFEVVAAHLPNAPMTPLREALDASVETALQLPAGLAQQQAALADARLDVLFFPDIGMNSASYWLARARLAPVQAVGWGHPDTTGLSSLDYFVSFAGAEPASADDVYSERLVRLPRLPCHYPPPASPAPRRRAVLGLPETGRLYGCLQSLFKLHPDFDAVLAEIVERDPEGWLVFATGPNPAWEQRLRRRWARTPKMDARAIFLPRRPFADYLATVAALDVHLDTPHFGSGATFYDAMAVGAPVVTWPGAFARGRVVAGLYGQMGVGADLIVDRLEDYPARAVAVARDGYDRAALRAAADAELFEDDRAVAGFAAFLEAAVEAAGRGERLPARWAPR